VRRNTEYIVCLCACVLAHVWFVSIPHVAPDDTVIAHCVP